MERKPDIKELVLKHHGVQGMHWGTRKGHRAEAKRYRAYNKGMKILDRHRLKKMTNASDRNKYLDEKDKKWLNRVNTDKNIQKVSKRAATEMRKVNKQLKAEYGGTGVKGNTRRAVNGQLNAQYHKAMKEAYTEVLANHTFAVYKLSPSRTREVEIKSLPDGTLKATVVERNNPKLSKQRSAITKSVNKILARQAKQTEAITHADQTGETSKLDGMFFIIKMDADGFPDEVLSPFGAEQTSNENVQHSGIEGIQVTIKPKHLMNK